MVEEASWESVLKIVNKNLGFSYTKVEEMFKKIQNLRKLYYSGKEFNGLEKR